MIHGPSSTAAIHPDASLSPGFSEPAGLAQIASPSPADASEQPTNCDDAASSQRRQLLLAPVVAVGAALLAGGTLAAQAHTIGGSEQEALRFLEALESMQAEFFARAAASPAYIAMEPRERNIISALASQDREHAEWFRLARQQYHVVSESASQAPRNYTFPLAAFNSRATLLGLAVSIKETAVGAYQSIAGRIDNSELIEAIASLGGVEERHAATLRECSGFNPLPVAFEIALPLAEVRRRLGNYGFSGEIA